MRAGSFRPVAAPLACPGAKLSARAGGICTDARHLAAKLRALRLPVRSQGRRLRAGATVPGNTITRTKLWLCGRLSCRMLPGSHTRAIIFNSAPTAPVSASRTSGAGGIEYNSVLCVHRLRRCHADCLPPSPGGTQPPVAWQSSRQLAGIRHASRPLPPFTYLRGEELV